MLISSLAGTACVYEPDGTLYSQDAADLLPCSCHVGLFDHDRPSRLQDIIAGLSRVDSAAGSQA